MVTVGGVVFWNFHCHDDVNENKKSLLKLKKKIEKQKKFSGDMVDSYLATKIGINSLDGFWENAFYGRTDDWRPRHGIKLFRHSQAELLKTHSGIAKK